MLGIAACGDKTDSTDGPITTQPGAGTSGGAAPGAGTGVPGAGTGAPAAGTGAPAAGTGAPTAGTGSPAGGSGGMDEGTAGTDAPTAGSGSPDGGEAGSGGPDTSDFLEDCMQGGAQWGTEQPAGPCKSGVTLYGVKTQFGPYGVRSEYNGGQGFEPTVSASDSAAGCSLFIDSFGADPTGSADLKDTHDLDLSLYTVFYPGVMPEGEKFPLISWGNGTCAMPEGYGPLLRYVASFGYIVVAANNRYVGSGEPQRKAIDFMLAENDKPDSKYYQKVDADKIGAMGHSQGGMGTAAAASDARISTVILWNGGTSASKPFLAVSGDGDIGATAASQLANAANAAPRPAAYIWYHQIPTEVDGSTTGLLAPGHLTLMMEPERVIEPAVAWFDMMLKGSDTAKQMFIGDSCTLCDPNAFSSMWAPPAIPGSATDISLEYGHNTMLQ